MGGVELLDADSELVEEETEAATEPEDDAVSIQSISIDLDEGIVYSPIQASRNIPYLPVTVNYSDGSWDTISEWSWSRDVSGLTTMIGSTQKGKRLTVTMTTIEGEEIGLPNFNYTSGYSINTGQYNLKVSYESQQEDAEPVSVSMPIEIALPENTKELSLDSTYPFTVGNGEEQWFVFTPQEDGNYVFSLNAGDYKLYRREADGSLYALDFGRGGFEQNLQAGSAYYIGFYDINNWTIDTALTVKRKLQVKEISIDTSEIQEVSQFDPGSVLWRLPVTLTYDDGSRETITSWSGYSDGETLMLGIWTGNNDFATVKLTKSLGEEEILCSIPYSDGLFSETGEYILTASVGEENPVSSSAQITVIEPSWSWKDLSLGASMSYSVPYGEQDAYRVISGGEDETLRIEVEEGSSTGINIYKKSQDGQIALLTNEYYYGGETFGYPLKGETGEEYYIFLEAAWEDSTALGSISLEKKKTLSEITIESEAQWSGNALAFSYMLDKLSVTAELDDGSTETLGQDRYGNSKWSRVQVYDDESSHMEMEVRSGNGDVVRAKLVDEAGAFANVPYGDEFSLEPGNYTLTIYVEGNETVAPCVINVTVTEVEWKELSLDDPISYNLAYGEYETYQFSVQAGEYVLRGERTGDDGYVDIILYEKTEAGEFNHAYSMGMYDKQTYAWNVDKEKEYRMIVKGGSEDTKSAGTLSLEEKASIESIVINGGEDWKGNVFSFTDACYEIPITLIKSNGEQETLDTQMWGESWESDDVNGGSYREIAYSSADGDEIRLKLQREDGSCVSLPYRYENDIMVPGNYTLTAYDRKRPEMSAKINVSPEIPDSVDLSMDETSDFSVSGAEHKYYKISPSSAGSYRIILKAIEDSEFYADLYKKNVQGGYNYAEGSYIWREKNFKIETLESQEEYILDLYSSSSFTASGTVALKQMKKAVAVSLDGGPIQLSALEVTEDNFPYIPATVTYEDNTTETVNKWENEWVYGDNGEEWNVAVGQTGNGDEVTLKMYRSLGEDGNIQVDMPCDGSVPVGDLQMIASVGEYMSDPIQVTISEPSGASALELDQEKTVEKTGWYAFTAEAADTYVIRDVDGVYLEFSTYLYDSSEQILRNIYEYSTPAVATMDEGDICCLRVSDYDECAGLLVTKRKEATGYEIDGQDAVIDGLQFADWIENISVTVYYGEDDTSETVLNWRYDYDWDEDDNEYNYLWANTSQGDQLTLRLFQNDLPMEFPYRDEWGYVPLGDIEVKLQTEETEVVSRTITVNQPDGASAQVLTPGEAVNISLAAGASCVYKLTGETDQEEQYAYSLTGIPVFHRYRQFRDGRLYQYGEDGWDGVYSSAVTIYSGETHYMRMGAKDKACSGVLQTRFSTSKSEKIEVVSGPALTEYVEGLNAGSSGTVDFTGTAVRFTYSNGDSTVVVPDEWFHVEDGLGNYDYLRLYMTDENGELPRDEYGDLDWEMEYIWEDYLPAGKYILILEDDQKEISRITVLTKEAAAERNLFDEEAGTVTFQNLNGYYVCTAYTPKTSGSYTFGSDRLLRDVQIFRISEGEETKVTAKLNGGYEFGASLEAGEKYIIALRPAASGGSLTLTAKAGGREVSEAKLSPDSQEAVELVAGLEVFDNDDWNVALTYEDGSQSVTLQGAQADQDGNAFRYEVKNKNTGKVVSKDAVWENLNIGSYLVTAVHRTLSALRSNTVEVQAKAAQSSGEIREDVQFTLQESDGYQFFSFTPETSGSYELKTEVNVTANFYTQGKKGLVWSGDTLAAGETYLLAVDRSPLTQTAAVSRVTGEETKQDQTITFEMPAVSDEGAVPSVRYRFTPQETGRYYISLEAEDAISQMIHFTVRDEDGRIWSSLFASDRKAHVQCTMEAGKEYLICVQGNRVSQAASCSLKIEKATLPSGILVTEKESVDHLFGPYVLGVEELFEVRFQYADGTVSDPLTADNARTDAYGNELTSYYWEDYNLSNALRYYFEVDGAEEISQQRVLWLSTDTSDLQAVEKDTPVPVDAAVGKPAYFKFTPEATGAYYVNVDNGQGQKDCAVYMYSAGKDCTWVNMDESMTLVKGVTYAFCVTVYDDSQEDCTFTVGSPKAVTKLELVTEPQGGLLPLENPAKGMTVKAAYADGTTKIISALNASDGYGNAISTQTRILPDGGLRVILTCGSCYVSGEAKTLSAEELTAVSGQWSDVPIGSDGAAVLSFTPTVSGLYRLDMNTAEELIVDAAIYTEDLKSAWNISRFVYLKGGVRYILGVSVYMEGMESLSLQLKMAAKDGQVSCDHVWDEGRVTKAPTCVEPGEKTYTCSECEAVKTETLEKDTVNGHAWEERYTVDQEATCTTAGSESIHCSLCGSIQEGSQREIQAKGHTWDEGQVTKPATCVASGLMTYTCTVCGEKKVQTTEKDTVNGHDWEEEYTTDQEATCTETGRKSIHCGLCGSIQEGSRQEIEAKGHTWSENWTVDQPATCTEDGSQSHHCTVCDAKDETTAETIEKLGHSYLPEEERILIQATCTTAGSVLKKCSRCREEITEDIQATGHQWGQWEVTTPAGCTEDGVETRSCQNQGCDAKELSRIPATGHVFDEQAEPLVKAATADENGREYWLCQNGCGEEKVKRVLVRTEEQEKIDALNKMASSEEVSSSDLVDAVAKIDNQALLDANEEAAAALLADLEKKLVDSQESEGNVKIAATQVEGDETIAAAGITVTGAAVTVAAVAGGDAPEVDTTYSAKIVLSDAETGTDASGNAYYQVDISMYTVVGGEQQATKTELQAPITITMPVPAGYENVDFDLYHHTDGGKVKLAYTRSGNTITFSTPSLSNFSFENGSCQDGHNLAKDETASVAATCTQAGSDVYRCSNANCDYTETQPVAALDHDYKETSRTGATCEVAGSIVYQCQNEGCSAQMEVTIEKTAHIYGAWTVTKPATCTEEGAETRTCTECGAEDTKTLKKVSHTYNGTYTVDREATCKEPGQESLHCTVCGAIKEDTIREIPVSAQHSWDEGQVTKKPTCLSEGERTYTCTVCGTKKTESIPPVVGEDGTGAHQWVQKETPSTCVQQGETWTECELCGEIQEDSKSELPLAEHSYSQEWTVDQEPDCENAGMKSHHCTVEGCGAKTDETPVDALGHAAGDWVTTRERTCTADGERQQKCTRCEKVLNTETVKAWGGHTGGTATCQSKAVCTRCGQQYGSLGAHTGGAATCKAKAVCKVCGQQYGSLAAHTAGSWKVTKAPTCAVAGVETLTCRVCGAAMQTRYKAATGRHTWGAYKVTKNATALSTGTKVRNCTVCKKQDTAVSIPKLTPTIKVNASSLTMKTKQSTSKLTVTGLASGDYVKSWKSSNTKIVKVSGKSNGTCKLTAQNKAGNATLTITLASGKKATVKIKVQKGSVKTTKITVNNVTKNKLTLNKGKKFTLSTTLTPFTSQDKVTYTSSNKSVATVSAKGVITAKKSGKTTITVKAGSKKVKVTVTVPKTATKKINKVPASVTIKKGKKYTLKPKLSPANSEEKITYTSSKKSVATVSSKGVITAKKKGTATITVKSGKISVKCKVTVK